MANYTITLTQTEEKALNFAGIDNPAEHAQNFVSNKARKSVDKIVSIYTTNALDNSHSIPATREDIVSDAFVKGYIKTVAAQNAEMEAARGE